MRNFRLILTVCFTVAVDAKTSVFIANNFAQCHTGLTAGVRCDITGRRFCYGNMDIVFMTEKDCNLCHTPEETFKRGAYGTIWNIGVPLTTGHSSTAFSQCGIDRYGVCSEGNCDKTRNYLPIPTGERDLRIGKGPRVISYADDSWTELRDPRYIGISGLAWLSTRTIDYDYRQGLLNRLIDYDPVIDDPELERNIKVDASVIGSNAVYDLDNLSRMLIRRLRDTAGYIKSGDGKIMHSVNRLMNISGSFNDGKSGLFMDANMNSYLCFNEKMKLVTDNDPIILEPGCIKTTDQFMLFPESEAVSKTNIVYTSLTHTVIPSYFTAVGFGKAVLDIAVTTKLLAQATGSLDSSLNVDDFRLYLPPGNVTDDTQTGSGDESASSHINDDVRTIAQFIMNMSRTEQTTQRTTTTTNSTWINQPAKKADIIGLAGGTFGLIIIGVILFCLCKVLGCGFKQNVKNGNNISLNVQNTALLNENGDHLNNLGPQKLPSQLA